MSVHGKRGCALKTTFVLHVIAFCGLLVGCFSPFWAAYDNAGTAIASGILLDYELESGNIVLRDFNIFKGVSTNDTLFYLEMSTICGMTTIFLEFFVLQAYGFALYNASCGKKYSPPWLIFFSLLSGIFGIACLVLYQQFAGKVLAGTEQEMVFGLSRAFVTGFIGCSFLAAFVSACDISSGGKVNPSH